jgi:uncharacterized Tic20 family protein
LPTEVISPIQSYDRGTGSLHEDVGALRRERTLSVGQGVRKKGRGKQESAQPEMIVVVEQWNDWFASNLICICGFLFVVGIIGLIWWQWRAKNPIMNLRLFKYKNFAICCLLMILVGGVLNAATVLEPQFLQQLMGYTATRAGEALAGGGIILLVMMPLAGVATGRFPARNMTGLSRTGVM